MEKTWCVYILECADGTLYTGITNDLDNRLKAHNRGLGAKYTRGRGPVILRFTAKCADHSAALVVEYKIKRLSREAKQKLCDNYCAME